MDSLPKLSQSIRDYGLHANKKLGQHFLLDPSILQRIAGVAEPLENTLVVEIGPGPGGLTRALLAAGARVVALERDQRCLPLLNDLVKAADGRLVVVHGDALETSINDLTAGRRCRIIANLPYNIGTELLIRWLHELDGIVSLHLLFQAEVAERLVAKPGTKAYGRLAILAQAHCIVRAEFRLPAGAFHPPPKVESMLVSLEPLAQRPAPVITASLERLTAAAFGQRRKMLRSSLRSLDIELDAFIEGTRVLPTMRADQLTVDDYLILAGRLAALSRAAGGISEQTCQGAADGDA